MLVTIMFILLIVLVLVGVPIAFSIGFSGVFYYIVEDFENLMIVPQRMWSGSFSFIIIAMPLFILAGELMNTGGITKRLVAFCRYMVRPFGGGLGEVNIVASMIFGGISGSSVADTSAIGSILIPAMEKEKYPSKFAAGVTVASSTMGMIVPPSVPMIMYAMVANESIGKLFMAGLIPGISIGIIQLVVCYVISKKKGYLPEKTPFDRHHFIHTMISGLPAILLPFIIIVCISFGVCTASESAGIAVLYALILGCVVYKELKWRDIVQALRKTLVSSSSIMLIMCFTYVFTYILTIENIPETLAELFLGLNFSHEVMLFIFMVFLLLVGMFVDVAPAILLICPIMLPVMQQFGINGLQFGAMVIVALAIGLVTPPIGMCLNACNKINGMSIIDIFISAIPFIICNIIVLILCTYWKPFSLWLPSLISY